jgi:SPP1 family predicted phage head-tail adaptor
VTIKDKVVARDTYGEEDVTWTDVAAVWAEILPIRGREYLEMDQAQADVTHRVYLRWRTGIEPTMRLYFGSRVLQIESVIRPEERRVGLELICKELVDV